MSYTTFWIQGKKEGHLSSVLLVDYISLVACLLRIDMQEVLPLSSGLWAQYQVADFPYYSCQPGKSASLPCSRT